MLKLKIHNFASPFGRSEFHLVCCRCDADTLFMSPQFFWDSAALESLGSETRNIPKQPIIAMELIHVAVWLLVSSLVHHRTERPQIYVKIVLYAYNVIYIYRRYIYIYIHIQIENHEVDSVNMSHVPKLVFSHRFGSQYVA